MESLTPFVIVISPFVLGYLLFKTYKEKKQIKTLGHMPQRCRISLYTKSENTHDIICKGYTIVYKIIDNTVHILSVFRQRIY